MTPTSYIQTPRTTDVNSHPRRVGGRATRPIVASIAQSGGSGPRGHHRGGHGDVARPERGIQRRCKDPPPIPYPNRRGRSSTWRVRPSPADAVKKIPAPVVRERSCGAKNGSRYVSGVSRIRICLYPQNEELGCRGRQRRRRGEATRWSRRRRSWHPARWRRGDSLTTRFSMRASWSATCPVASAILRYGCDESCG